MDHRGQTHGADPTQRHPPATVQRDGSAASHSWSRASARGRARPPRIKFQNRNVFLCAVARIAMTAARRGDGSAGMWRRRQHLSRRLITQNGRRSTSSVELDDAPTNQVEERDMIDSIGNQWWAPIAASLRRTAKGANHCRDLFCGQAVHTGVTQRCWV